MRKVLFYSMWLIFIVALVTSCVKKENIEKKELVIFAAASMTETLNEIAVAYQEVAPDVELILNYDSSGTLKTQIESGAYVDIFISASQETMDAMDSINSDSRVVLLKNSLGLVVSERCKYNISSFQEMIDLLITGEILLAIGNRDVPAGVYAMQVLEFYEILQQDLNALGSITYATNVKEVTTQVSQNSVDCGMIYVTDAVSAGLEVVEIASEDMCESIVYPIGIAKESNNQELAQEFLTFLKTETCADIFERVGFITTQ